MVEPTVFVQTVAALLQPAVVLKDYPAVQGLGQTPWKRQSVQSVQE